MHGPERNAAPERRADAAPSLIVTAWYAWDSARRVRARLPDAGTGWKTRAAGRRNRLELGFAVHQLAGRP